MKTYRRIAGGGMFSIQSKWHKRERAVVNEALPKPSLLMILIVPSRASLYCGLGRFLSSCYERLGKRNERITIDRHKARNR